MRWEAIRIAGGQDSPVAKAAKKVRTNQQVVTRWSPALLQMELDRWLWKDAPHVGFKRVWECLTTYLYLSRLRDEDVLLDTVREGIRSRDYFAYASSVSPDGRYQGLQFGSGGGSLYLDDQSVLVKPGVAAKQVVVEMPTPAGPGGVHYPTTSTGTGAGVIANGGRVEAGAAPEPPVSSSRSKRFHGSVNLDPARLVRDAGQIAQEVIQHFTGLVGANVEVTLEIQVSIPDGVSENVERIVTENCKTLRFTTQGFEAE